MASMVARTKRFQARTLALTDSKKDIVECVESEYDRIVVLTESAGKGSSACPLPSLSVAHTGTCSLAGLTTSHTSHVTAFTFTRRLSVTVRLDVSTLYFYGSRAQRRQTTSHLFNLTQPGLLALLAASRPLTSVSSLSSSIPTALLENLPIRSEPVPQGCASPTSLRAPALGDAPPVPTSACAPPCRASGRACGQTSPATSLITPT
jgi:hypothetical protein